LQTKLNGIDLETDLADALAKIDEDQPISQIVELVL
jgi:hypothetical protein